MDTKTNQLDKYRETANFISLIAVAAVFPFSEALVSIATGVLLFQALALFSWNHPGVKWSSFKIALFPVSVFIVYLAGTVFTSDFDFALYELKKTVFWAVVPIAFFISPRLTEKRIYIVLFVFISSVTVASLIYTGKLALSNFFNFAEYRSLSIISHIRFSLQVIFALILLGWMFFFREKIPYRINSIIILGLMLWLTFFLILLKSLIGIIAFLGVLAVVVIITIAQTKSTGTKVSMATLLLVIIVFPSFYTGYVVRDFYDFEEISPENLEMFTPSGNPYHHDLEQELRENGNLVYIYVCDEELRQEWNKRSVIKYDDDVNGYILGSTLVRYLASKGYRKDSVGVSRLTAEDVEMIQNGITNYKFRNHAFSIYPRVYETVWELDYYNRTGDPNGKTLAQRIEFLKASFLLIKDNPVFGIGTGNWMLKYNEAYEQMNSRLSIEKRASSHNQYVNYLVKFGVIGFLWILFAIIYPVFRLNRENNLVLLLFLTLFAFACLGDAHLESHMGLSFFTFFYCFFLRNSLPGMVSAKT